jgi:CubicO group peptidase (beta-lactamase class C family)
MFRNHVLLFLLVCVALSAGAQETHKKSMPGAYKSRLTARIDRLFAPWNKRTTPGGVLAILQDGKILYKRSYGMANLEYAIPNEPATLFQIASVSKQFTAFAIHLLAQERKLSLDDNVRKYVPELHNFGKTITIRHLLHHTSGLRDTSLLLWLGGWRFEDVVTEEDVLHVISQQRELNFPPGEEEFYSNAGYVLLAAIVKRVSGKSLSEFSRERIFMPLGMKHTIFQDDYRLVVKHRAYPYQPKAGGGYEGVSLTDSTVGQTGIVTHVEDLALWEKNFEEGQVGGKSLLSEMQKQGKLNNGRESIYASGLGIQEYRGLKKVEHSGSNPGYRSHFLRFPDQHFSVIVLSNAADMNTTDLAHRVADIYLEGKLHPLPAKATPPVTSKFVEVAIDPKILDAYVGDYEFKPGDVVAITREKNQLMAQGTGAGKVPLYPSSETTFFLKNAPAQLTFVRPEDAREAQALVLQKAGEKRTAKRINCALLTDFVGKFYSEELNVLYTVTLREGKLFLRFPRGEMAMVRTLPDTFELPFPIGTLRFTRGASKDCNGFTIDNGRVRNLRFVKVEMKPVGQTTSNGVQLPIVSASRRCGKETLPPEQTTPTFLPRSSSRIW